MTVPLASPAAAVSARSLDEATLPPAVTERLNRIRLHIDGLTPREIEQLVEQAFRNFHGLNTDRLVRLLIPADQ